MRRVQKKIHLFFIGRKRVVARKKGEIFLQASGAERW